MNRVGKPLAGAILVVAFAAAAASCGGSSGTIDAVVRRGRIASV